MIKLAAKANPDGARVAAFDLAETEDKDLRAAAAEVLDGTPPKPDDADRLSVLIEREKVRSISNVLERAHRAISTSTIDEALNQLLQLLQLTDEYSSPLDPKVLLPDENWHPGFINDVNDLRVAGRAPDSPRNFINVACGLADTMAEQALVARNDADPKATTLSAAQVKAIRKNQPSKPSIGGLLEMQHNQSTFGWFNELIALRRYRAAHTAPAGDTKPRQLGEREHGKTLGYLEDVVHGWVASMYETDSLT